MSNCTSAECPSFETRSEPWASVAARMFVTTGIAATRARMSRIAALNAGSEIRAVALWTSADSCAGVGKRCSSVFSALPDWPLNWSALVSLLVPNAEPSTTDATTKTSQPASTDFLCRALQPPTAAAMPFSLPARNMVGLLHDLSTRDGMPRR